MMKTEITSAVEFLRNTLQSQGPLRSTQSPSFSPSKGTSTSSSISSSPPTLRATSPSFEPESPSVEQLDIFQSYLYQLLENRFSSHWFPENPSRGSGYRSITFFGGKIDSLVMAAGNKAGISLSYLSRFYSADLVLWIDPSCVSYRISDYGYTHIIYEDASRNSFAASTFMKSTLSAQSLSYAQSQSNIAQLNERSYLQGQTRYYEPQTEFYDGRSILVN
ncbi:hypothetical protein HK096_003070 [Nowakowskiella sp. JEL0078]|nr:hypothetical protein HK096_003070 [Nowakowskiella sp. JEL0078]